MGLDVELAGLSDLAEELERMVDNAAKIEEEALKAAAEPVLAEAKSTTAFHDRTGRLRKSLKISGVKKDKTGKYVLVGSFGEAFYGRYIEFGTSRIAARPFLAPALERRREEAVAIIAAKLREALNK